MGKTRLAEKRRRDKKLKKELRLTTKKHKKQSNKVEKIGKD